MHFSFEMIHHHKLFTYLIKEIISEHNCRCVACDSKIINSHLEATIKYIKAKKLSELKQEKIQAVRDLTRIN